MNKFLKEQKKVLMERHGATVDRKMKECGGNFKLYIWKTCEESRQNLERILKIKIPITQKFDDLFRPR